MVSVAGDDGAWGRMFRVLSLAVGSAGVVFLLIAQPPLLAQWTMASWWWNALAICCVLVPPVSMSIGAFWFPLRWLKVACTVLVLGYLPVLVLTPFAFSEDVIALDHGWPWPPAISAAVLCAAPLVVPTRAIAPYTVVFAVALSIATWWPMEEASWFRIAQTFVGAPLFGLIFAGVSSMALRSGATLDRDTEVMRSQAARRVAAAAKSTERARVDALVHDTVLSALLSAGRGADEGTARRSAAAGLATLDGSFGSANEDAPIAAVELLARLRQVCADIDDNVVFTAVGSAGGADVTALVAQVLQEVLGEAVRNSVRHAQLPGRPVLRTVTARVESGEIALQVTDDGVGFDPRRVPPRRLGIAVGMRARIAQLPGARLSIESAPGKGTVVRIAAPTDAVRLATATEVANATVDEMAATTAPRAVRLHGAAAMTLGFAWLTNEATRPWEDRSVGLVGLPFVAAVALLAAGLLLLLRPGPDPMPWRPAAALAAVPVLAALCNVAAMSGPHAYMLFAVWSWHTGTLLMAFLTVRGRFLLAWLGCLGASGVYLLWLLQPHTEMGADFAAQFAWQVMLLAVCSLFGATIRRQVNRINATRSRALALAAERAESETRLRERDKQLAYLNTVARPMLERIRERGVLAPTERKHALLLEARLRDRIRARGLATEQLLDAATRARDRGVEVVLLDDGALDIGTLTPLIDIVVRELDETVAERVTIRILPAGREALCTIVHVGDESYRRIEIGHDELVAA